MGLWHAGLLGAVGRALEDRGYRCLFALPDPVLARAVVGPAARVVPAPVYVPPGAALPADLQTTTFADVLGAAGFGDRAVLDALTGSWDALLELARPAVVVADHAPALLAAARGRAPVVALGLGFTTPEPALPRFPALHDGAAGSYDEGRVLAVVNAVLAARGAPTLLRLPALWDVGARFVTVLPDFDPYHPVRAAPALGPVRPLPPDPAPLGGEAVFAYLAGDDPRAASLLAALARRGPVRAVVREGLPAAARDACERAGVVLERGLVDLDAALAAADVVVHHGGVGTAEAAVFAARPQLLLPRHLEHRWNAHVLASRGVGVALPDGSDAALDRALSALRSPAARDAAAAWAPVAAAQVEPDAAEIVAARAAALAEVWAA
ncbi:MAG: hypothetical protein H6745_04825 [Deltaproteobacteria bacterium]|nr:hypothetical protein [Deltaproteobacteria bacterium]